MAATVSIVSRRNAGDQYRVVADVTFDSAYATGGEALTPAQFGLSAELEMVIAAPSGGYVFEYDHAGDTLMAFIADYSGSTDGPLIEAAADTDLDAITARVIAYGY